MNESAVGNGIAVIVITLDRHWSETAYLSQYHVKGVISKDLSADLECVCCVLLVCDWSSTVVLCNIALLTQHYSQC